MNATPQLNATVVLLAGGSGTRLWPSSRAAFPKQFLSFDNDRNTLFQRSLTRLSFIVGANGNPPDVLIVGNEQHRFLVMDQLRELSKDDARMIVEPTGRNTAPALTFAALVASEDNADPVLIVSPSDQVVRDDATFSRALAAAIHQAELGNICTLGIVPTRPETGYGYICASDSTEVESNALPVRAFVEKPDAATAQRYLDSGGYYWNAGIFVVKASVWLQLIEQYRPDIAAPARLAWERHSRDNRFLRPETTSFDSIPSESIDYAVMEPLSSDSHASVKIKVVPLDAGWSDLGSWDAIWENADKDVKGNACVGDVLTENAHNNLVHTEGGRLVALVGVQDLVVVETADAILVADKRSSQDVKKIVAALGEQKREESNLHRKVHRPWGWYDSIDEDSRFKVKRILVKPGASLSLQMHHHRAEHWVVVSGTAEVTCGDKTVLLSENQSVYIPLGETHRLYNPGKLPLEIIEVQSGSYLGEDDIVRFEDNYGRATS